MDTELKEYTDKRIRLITKSPTKYEKRSLNLGFSPDYIAL
jgi:hypothetical protein